MSVSRRHFLRTAGAVSLGFAGLSRLLGCASDRGVWRGFGGLQPDPKGVMDLPKGFSYRVISRAGEEMDDGLLVPGAHDGMAAFPGPGGKTLVVRNHEVSPATPAKLGPLVERLGRLPPDSVYDPGRGETRCPGGTTTLVYDTRTGRLDGHFLSLAGTVRNCAGGPTPWNAWITCEESVARADDSLARDHGYCFEVPASEERGLAAPVPLRGMGRFNHEAVAVDPVSGVVYETEDRGDGLIYRFLPDRPGRLAAGGRLQALAVRDRKGLDTRNWEGQAVPKGAVMDVEWVDMEDLESPKDDLRLQGFGKGAARFARGEGMWYGRDAVYFACTNGGKAKKGQVWRYTPSPVEGRPEEQGKPGRLELFLEPNDGNLVENADNLTVAPWGDLVLCEDGPKDDFLVGVTPEGEVYRFGRNATSESELAGATFSPDGSTLFVNIQGAGITLAVTGPWRARA